MATIYPLSEGEFTIGHDKQFVPFDPAADELNDRPTGSLLVEVQPFLVLADQELILFDAGLGFPHERGELQIHHNIRLAGFEPDRVTRVLLTHLHKDHAGGVTCRDAQGRIVPSFPNALYHIYRKEAEFAMEKGLPSYIPSELEPLFSSGQVSWLEGTEGAVSEHIRFRHSGGHCPQHIVFLLEHGPDRLFFGGDEAPQYRQMILKYVAKYDYDGKKAMKLREAYAAEGKEQGWQFLFYHDIHKPVARMP